METKVINGDVSVLCGNNVVVNGNVNTLKGDNNIINGDVITKIETIKRRREPKKEVAVDKTQLHSKAFCEDCQKCIGYGERFYCTKKHMTIDNPLVETCDDIEIDTESEIYNACNSGMGIIRDLMFLNEFDRRYKNYQRDLKIVEMALNEIALKIDGLKEREQKVIRMSVFERKPLEVIAREEGVTKERIRQIMDKGFRKMRYRTSDNCKIQDIDKEKIKEIIDNIGKHWTNKTAIKVLKQRYIYNKPIKEIATMCNISVGMVESYLRRGKGKISIYVDAKEDVR